MKQPLKLLISIANEVEELADMDSDALSPYEQYLQKELDETNQQCKGLKSRLEKERTEARDLRRHFLEASEKLQAISARFILRNPILTSWLASQCARQGIPISGRMKQC